MIYSAKYFIFTVEGSERARQERRYFIRTNAAANGQFIIVWCTKDT